MDQTKKFNFWIVLLGCMATSLTYAGDETPVAKKVAKETCGVLQRFGGHVQVLSETLSEAVEAKVGLPLACDSWISVSEGWAFIQHSKGFQTSLGAESFAQIQSGEPSGKDVTDAWVLYRGQAYFKSDESQGPLVVSTANARMRMKGGTGYLVYSSKEEDTQFTSLTQSHTLASLENKHAPDRKIDLKPGELTSLNLKALRVVPSTPKVASIATLRARFKDLHTEEMDMKVAKEAVKERQERSIASDEPVNQAKPEQAIEHPDEKGSAAEGVEPMKAVKKPAKLSKKPIQKNRKDKKTEQRDPASEETEKARLLRELMKIQPDEN